MSTTVTLLALALGLGQGERLTLANVRTAYSVSGPTRPDNKILPGDLVVLSFDIEGAKVNAAGKVLYSMALEVANPSGKVLFRQAPKDLEAPLPAGAKGLPAAARVQVGFDREPGEYTLKVKVTDRASGAAAEVARAYELLPRGFGIVRLSTTTDQEGQKPAVAFQRGKSFWINFSVVDFARSKTTGQPHVVAEMQVRNQKGQELLSRPSTGESKKDVPDKALALPLQFELELNRAGTFTIELKATDKIAGKTATLSFPVTVPNQK
jgi:hypothetical protein